MHSAGCEIVLVDRNGTKEYLCGSRSMGACMDCGTKVCELHAEECEFCCEIFCTSCYYYFHLDQLHKKRPPSVRPVGKVSPHSEGRRKNKLEPAPLRRDYITSTGLLITTIPNRGASFGRDEGYSEYPLVHRLCKLLGVLCRGPA
jgi:hypothetical protein